jgi:ribosome-associated protein YbcJ (S4-like RNA binding protein)
MRKFNLQRGGTIALVGLLWSGAGFVMADPALVERVQLQDGKMWMLLDGKLMPMTEDVTFPREIKVSTNGTFTVQNRRSRPLRDGQILSADGMLLSADGRIEPVLDHVALTAGRTFSSVDGEANLAGEVRFSNGARLTPDRALLGPNGSWMRVIDGQLLTPDGATIPARDTISLRDGRVVVQKDGPLADGSLLTLPPTRSLMMNEGTKVFGDGTVQTRDGQMIKLTEGQTLVVEGVVKLR